MIEFQRFPALTSEDHEATVTIASGTVIIHDGKVVLVRSGSEPWKVPGGSSLDGESFKETCIREVKEAVGLDIEIISEPFIYSFTRYDKEREIISMR